jgi:antitoxin Phd
VRWRSNCAIASAQTLDADAHICLDPGVHIASFPFASLRSYLKTQPLAQPVKTAIMAVLAARYPGNAMRTMTSLEAQNHFGEMIDTSQREPVLITRRGRPVSVVISPQGDTKEALFQFMKVMSELAPLRGKEASGALTRFFSGNDRDADAQKLTEEDVSHMIHESE